MIIEEGRHPILEKISTNRYVSNSLAMDKEKQLSDYIWNGIHVFNEIYENEINLTK